MTLLEVVNKFICQWFFFRICKIVKDGKIIAWGFHFWPYPMTGWNRPYKYFLNKRFTIRIFST